MYFLCGNEPGQILTVNILHD